MQYKNMASSSFGKSRSTSHRQHSGGGGGGSSGEVALSKALSWLLRHNAVQEGFVVEAGGWVDLELIMKHSQFTQWGIDDVKKVVKENDKQRFSLREVNDRLQIRANQGHSYKVDDKELLEPITDPSLAPIVIHGTYLRHWKSIQTSGLSRMTRNHIHFAAGNIGTHGVISGLRTSAQVYIYVDIEKAMQDGIKFYRSSNNVILSPGNDDGYLETKYFQKVVNAKTKTNFIL